CRSSSVYQMDKVQLSGRTITSTAMAMLPVVEGRVPELPGAFDALGRRQQLGALPTPEPREGGSSAIHTPRTAGSRPPRSGEGVCLEREVDHAGADRLRCAPGA